MNMSDAVPAVQRCIICCACGQFVREPVTGCDASVVEHLACWSSRLVNVVAFPHPWSSIPRGLWYSSCYWIFVPLWNTILTTIYKVPQHGKSHCKDVDLVDANLHLDYLFDLMTYGDGGITLSLDAGSPIHLFCSNLLLVYLLSHTSSVCVTRCEVQ